jgi:hypothetical protein
MRSHPAVGPSQRYDPSTDRTDGDLTMVDLDAVVALKIFACLVVCWLSYKFIIASKPQTSDQDNPFLKKRDKIVVDCPNYLYRLARESEPTRNAKGDIKEGHMAQHDRTVGSQTVYQLSLADGRRDMIGGYFGLPSEIDKICLHLWTADQVPSACKQYFAGVDDLILLKFPLAAIEKDASIQIKWEEVASAPPAAP